jgi:hypothetical protein
VWEHLWPPFHFNCRTTVRAIYDESEIEDAGGADKFYTQGAPDFTPEKGFGTYPLDKSDNWWNLTTSMEERAEEYGLTGEFEEAKEKLVESDKNLPDGENGFIIDEEKVAETLHKFETAKKDLNHEEGAIVGLDGRLIHTATGGAHEVDLPAKLIKGNIVTHNHPTAGSAFSVGDIQEFTKSDGHEIRVFAREGRFASLRKGTGEANKAFAEAMEKELGRDGDIRLTLAGDMRAMKKYGRGNYGLPEITQERVNIVNEWMKENAPKYGYIFTEGFI